MPKLSTTTTEPNIPRYYILVGDEETWKISLRNNLWGFSDNTKGLWNTTSDGDYLAFYVTSPVKKIIGFGRIKRKFIDTELIWPDETQFQRAIWKNRFEFVPLLVTDSWENGIPLPKGLMLKVGRKVIEKRVFDGLLKKAEKKWATKKE
jgi:hypothetical protein